MDRLGFWGSRHANAGRVDPIFQYPLMDRLGFWGARKTALLLHRLEFQYPLMDRLGFWGLADLQHVHGVHDFSIR